MQKTKVSVISKVFTGLLEQSALTEAGLISSAREWERYSLPWSLKVNTRLRVSDSKPRESSSRDSKFGVNILESLPSPRCLSDTFGMKGKDQWGILENLSVMISFKSQTSYNQTWWFTEF